MTLYTDFRKSTKSDGGSNCVEVSDAIDSSAVRVRDSKDQTGPVLGFGATAWASFIAEAKSGRFDLI